MERPDHGRLDFGYRQADECCIEPLTGEGDQFFVLKTGSHLLPVTVSDLRERSHPSGLLTYR